MRVAVIGHVEWIDFVRVPHLPAPGEIVHVTDAWEQPGGGGGVAAVQLARMADRCDFFTALGDDERGHRAHDDLRAMGVNVHAVFRPEPQRRGITHIDESGERTITVLGERSVPRRDDPLPWQLLDAAAGVYVTGCDAPALIAARRAHVLVATARALQVVAASDVRLDALVGSARDPAECYGRGDLAQAPGLVIRTDGPDGGEFEEAEGASQHFEPAPLPGPLVDTYGAGDTFAAAITFALASGANAGSAIAFAARCSAAVLTGRGPYGANLPGL